MAAKSLRPWPCCVCGTLVNTAGTKVLCEECKRASWRRDRRAYVERHHIDRGEARGHRVRQKQCRDCPNILPPESPSRLLCDECRIARQYIPHPRVPKSRPPARLKVASAASAPPKPLRIPNPAWHGRRIREHAICPACGDTFLAKDRRQMACGSQCLQRLRAVYKIAVAACTECAALVTLHGKKLSRYSQTGAAVCSTECHKKRAARHSRLSRERHPETGRRLARKNTALRRARPRGLPTEAFSHEEIFERDGYICGLCGKRVSRTLRFPHPRSASLDHILPASLGGAHVRSNVQCAHLGCNSAKNNRPQGEQLLLVG